MLLDLSTLFEKIYFMEMLKISWKKHFTKGRETKIHGR